MDWGLIQMNAFSWIHNYNIKPRVSVAQLGNAIMNLGNLWYISIVLSQFPFPMYFLKSE